MGDDYCAVCAENLEWTAYAQCGHTDTCSKCVARLRFVLNDTRCVICQQSDSAVVVTRYAGEYTNKLPASEFPTLKGRSRNGEFSYLPAAIAYFDDQQHFQHIRELCSFSHPAVEADASGKSRRFFSLKELRRALEAQGLHFCNVCLEGRKVFVSEQVVYTSADLKVHARSGDLTGPLAEAGFKGHPSCRFCRKAFYGDNELFMHMQQTHEQCFLCRRANPGKYLYYRDYAELEGHFRNEHFACDHPHCLEARFVVFPNEQELKQHRLREHNEQLSRNERRAALQIPVNLTYRRGGEAEAGGPAGMELRAGGRPGITIGGAEGVTSRFRSSRHTQEDSQVAAAMQASLQSSRQQPPEQQQQGQPPEQPPQQPQPAAAREDDFPAVGAAAARTTAAAASSSARWAAAAGGATRGGNMSGGTEAFPELPGQSKAARRRAAQQAMLQPRTLAQRLAPAGRGVRVLHRAADVGAAPPAANPTGRPRLPHSASEPSLAPRQQQQQQLQGGTGSGADAASDGDSRPASPAPRPAGRAPTGAAGWAAPESQEVAAPTAAADGFPALSAGQPRAAAAAARKGADRSNSGGWVTVAGARGGAAGGQPQGAGSAAPQPHEFPTLAGPSGGSRLGGGGRQSGRQGGGGQAAAGRAPPAAGAGAGGVSESLKAANKAFVERVRQRLSADDFAAFRQESASFMRGATSAAELHDRVTQLGVASMVPELAALCPDAGKRAELLAAHMRWAAAAQPAAGSGWVPPEAAGAAADHAERHASWECPVCTLVNGPDAGSCEACTSARPSFGSSGDSGNADPANVQLAQEAMLADAGTNSGANGGGNSPSSSSAKQQKGKGPKKVPKFERLRVTGGDAAATADWLDATGIQRRAPQNAWGKPAASSSAVRAPPAPPQPKASGVWGPSGTAKRDRVVTQTWSKQ